MDGTKQFAIVVEEHGGKPEYVDARNPRIIGHRSTLNPPPDHYTYSLLELRAALALLKKVYPNAQIEAHEVAHIDHSAMRDRWAAAFYSRLQKMRNVADHAR